MFELEAKKIIVTYMVISGKNFISNADIKELRRALDREFHRTGEAFADTARGAMEDAICSSSAPQLKYDKEKYQIYTDDTTTLLKLKDRELLDDKFTWNFPDSIKSRFYDVIENFCKERNNTYFIFYSYDGQLGDAVLTDIPRIKSIKDLDRLREELIEELKRFPVLHPLESTEASYKLLNRLRIQVEQFRRENRCLHCAQVLVKEKVDSLCLCKNCSLRYIKTHGLLKD